MHCHSATNNRAPWWTFTDPCKPVVRPGAREESASPAWLAAPAMNARDKTKEYIWSLDTGCGPTLYRKCHSENTPEKGIITFESNPSHMFNINVHFLWFSDVRECPSWCSIVCATVTVHQFFCILHCVSTLFPHIRVKMTYIKLKYVYILKKTEMYHIFNMNNGRKKHV